MSQHIQETTCAVSIIVPVFNVEKYLKRSLDCLVSQTLKNIEIILIDDGATDKSGAICDEYARLDDRIQVIHQKNHGQAAARNAGIRIARGDYILFVDPDDWYEVDMAEKLWRNAVESGAALTVGSYVSEFQSIAGCQREYILKKSGTFAAREAIAVLEASGAFLPCWGRLYLRRYLNNRGLLFREIRDIGEDSIFNMEVYLGVDKICLLQDVLYHYALRDDGTSSTQQYSSGFFEHMSALLGLRKKLHQFHGLEYDSEGRKLNRIYANYIVHVVWNMYHPNSTMNKKARYEVLNRLMHDEIYLGRDNGNMAPSTGMYGQVVFAALKTKNASVADRMCGVARRLERRLAFVMGRLRAYRMKHS